MKKVALQVGKLWNFPMTLVGLCYAFICTVLFSYKYVDETDVAYVFQVDEAKLPKFAQKLWSNWKAHTVGNLIFIKAEKDTPLWDVMMKHETAHVLQGMKLGVFLPVFYSLIYVLAKIACPNVKAYWANPFEIDAVIASNQKVDEYLKK